MIGPDFLGIGAQRAGTTWLYHALSRHPGLFLPPIKEIHYFDDPRRNRRYVRHLRQRLSDGVRGRRPWSAWDARYFLGARGDAWYCALFEPGRRRGLPSGEITPAYATLDEPALSRILALNPRVKLIFLMRDPVARTWSAIVNHDRKDGGAAPTSPARVLARLRDEGLRARSDYAGTVERLDRVFAPEQMFHGFFDDLVERPQTLVAGILRFLGVDPDDASRLLPDGPVNVAAAGGRPPPPLERALAAELLPGIVRLCARFEGPPHRWRARCEAILAAEGPGRAGDD